MTHLRLVSGVEKVVGVSVSRALAERERLSIAMAVLTERVDSLSQHVDERFEQVDARFEQVDARFEQLTSDMNSQFVELKKMIVDGHAALISAVVKLAR